MLIGGSFRTTRLRFPGRQRFHGRLRFPGRLLFWQLAPSEVPSSRIVRFFAWEGQFAGAAW